MQSASPIAGVGLKEADIEVSSVSNLLGICAAATRAAGKARPRDRAAARNAEQLRDR